jgi:hypothetical protein
MYAGEVYCQASEEKRKEEEELTGSQWTPRCYGICKPTGV